MQKQLACAAGNGQVPGRSHSSETQQPLVDVDLLCPNAQRYDSHILDQRSQLARFGPASHWPGLCLQG